MQIAISSQPATVLDVRKNYIRVAVSLAVSEFLEVQGAGASLVPCHAVRRLCF